jgi:hypothetical protein
VRESLELLQWLIVAHFFLVVESSFDAISQNESFCLEQVILGKILIQYHQLREWTEELRSFQLVYFMVEIIVSDISLFNKLKLCHHIPKNYLYDQIGSVLPQSIIYLE